MIFFKNIENIEELKRHYHKLARKFHPDKGGNMRLMQRLNSEYKEYLDEMLNKNNELRKVQIGDTVYVNGSECIVISSLERTFIAKSKITRRQALFDKYTGNCLSLKNYKASVKPDHYVK